MKKSLFVLATAIVALSLAFSGCKKDEPINNPSNPGGEAPSSNIIAYVYDTPMEIFRSGSIDICGNKLWFDMPSEGSAFHTPFEGVSILATPKVETAENWCDKAIPLDEGVEIGPSSNFSQNDTVSYIDWHWLDDVAYCGISFQKDGKTHYGWVKYKFITTSLRVFVYGYAYEDVPGKSIKAGATK